MDAIRLMTIGEVVDYCIAYNDRQKKAELEEKRGHKRIATQEDINNFFG